MYFKYISEMWTQLQKCVKSFHLTSAESRLRQMSFATTRRDCIPQKSWCWCWCWWWRWDRMLSVHKHQANNFIIVQNYTEKYIFVRWPTITWQMFILLAFLHPFHFTLCRLWKMDHYDSDTTAATVCHHTLPHKPLLQEIGENSSPPKQQNKQTNFLN